MKFATEIAKNGAELQKVYRLARRLRVRKHRGFWYFTEAQVRAVKGLLNKKSAKMKATKDDEYEVAWITCPDCKGQGHFYNGVSIRPCQRCANEGEIRITRKRERKEQQQ